MRCRACARNCTNLADKRLFFALWPSPEQRRRLQAGIDHALAGVRGKPVDRRNWHLTLVFIGSFPELRITELTSAVQDLDPGELTLRFDSLAYWKKPRIACLEARSMPPGLGELVTSLKRTMIPFGYAPETREYRPHITVARKVRPFADVRLARPVDLTWTDFELVESVSVPGGVRYYPLKQ